MKRFYQKAELGTAPGGYVVRLDGKILKTPLQNNLIFPQKDLMQVITDEWEAQAGEIIPAKMPMTQLVNTMIDKSSGPDRLAMNAEILKYAGSDLVCYFATHPSDLVTRQQKAWLPLIDWLRRTHDISLEVVQGIQYIKQPEESLRAFKRLIDKLSPADFTVIQAVTSMTGSAVIAFAFSAGEIDALAAHQASTVDENYQLEKWGEDTLARRKLDALEAELMTIAAFRDLTAAL